MFFLNLAIAEVYISVNEAIEKMFVGLERFESEERTLDGQPIKIFRIFKGSKVIGWAVKLEEMGKKMPMAFLVAISPEQVVMDVYLLEFRDLFGSDIKRRSFLRQFQGKTLRNPLSVGRDIDAVTGATISSHAATYAVRRALHAVEKLQIGQ